MSGYAEPPEDAMSRSETRPTPSRNALRRLLALPLTAVMALAAVALAPAPAHAAAQWNSGASERTWITNCPSYVFGTPYSEYGIGAFVSYWGDRASNPVTPAVGETTYLSVYTILLGSHCSDPRIFPRFVLPSGVAFDKSQPIACYYTPPGRNQTQFQVTHTGQCPQWSNVQSDGTYYNSYPNWDTGWPLPQAEDGYNGSSWEFLVPIRATSQQNGSQLGAYIQIADGNSNAPLSPTIDFWTGPPAVTTPGAPTNVTATATSPTSARVSFSPPASNGGAAITGYTAQCSSSDGGVTQTVSGTSSPIDVGSLTTGRSYRCQVRATNSAGAGAWSSQSASFTPSAPTVPGRPTNVVGTPTSSTTADVSFTTPSDGGSPITSYVARCVSANGGVTRAATGTSSPVTVRHMTGGASYSCGVRASNAVGNGEFSTYSGTFALPPTRPGVPTNVIATGATATSAQVSFSPPAWNGGSAITSYVARCSSPNGGTTRTRSAAGSPITVPNLTRGKSYQCQVRALNAVGASAYSALTSTFPLAASVPDPPRSVTVAPVTSSSARVTFQAPAYDGGSAITSYLARCVSTDGGVTRARPGAASPITVLSLTPGKGYRCQVRASNAVGNSAFSSLSSAIRLPG
ncbi:fibronectin type III domain-containing protein [Nocardioides antri]|uniref:Fibronectin type III domain-containing protein n=1 Tax=Nocardioides antri TaxID=2607659 RepID=A0A5B1M6X7_9ACTN|nr:fibronectin type III domain-containing protein [Nocardioides antri]KAA1427587.1 fibronectin type III domain-containing protein [Nocardioides antri]